MKPNDYYITPQDYVTAAANGIPAKTLEARVRKYGWDKQRALTQPVQLRQRKLKDLVKVAAANGIAEGTFGNRVRVHGWDPERAATTPVQDAQALAAAARRKYPAELHRLREANGIPYHTFISRVTQSGWSPERAATEPVWTHKQTCDYGLERYKEEYGANPNKDLFPHRGGGFK